jgi:AcrR family transcriptional regulator
VFARKGYADAVVDDIAAEVGIGKGTLYLYFPSKEQIYLAALIEDAAALDAESRSAMEAAKSWREALRAYVETRLRYFGTHEDFLRIYMTEFRGRYIQGHPAPAELHRLSEAGEAQLARIFAAASSRGDMRAVDPELAAMTVADLTRGLMERRLKRLGRPVGPADVEFAIEVMCRGLEG